MAETGFFKTRNCPRYISPEFLQYIGDDQKAGGQNEAERSIP
jgi:hypothetical protein